MQVRGQKTELRSGKRSADNPEALTMDVRALHVIVNHLQNSSDGYEPYR
jgi:hypothetical protein